MKIRAREMAGATSKIPSNSRISGEIVEFSDDDMVFGILEEWESSPENVGSSGDYRHYGDDEDEENSGNVEEDKAFWEAQDQILQAALCKSSSIESKIRQATKEARKELRLEGYKCVCRRSGDRSGCRNCLQREISNRLQNVGYNCVVCNSKWRSSPDIPSGEHSYLEVVDKSSASKKGEVRVLIELNFRAEFEMARGSEEYNRLISRLPEMFVGKSERLRALIKILCSAPKQCMKEKKMHLGPWRKHKYMQAKWSADNCERSVPAPLPVRSPEGHQKPKASMLTFDLLENLPAPLHCSTAVKVA